MFDKENKEGATIASNLFSAVTWFYTSATYNNNMSTTGMWNMLWSDTYRKISTMHPSTKNKFSLYISHEFEIFFIFIVAFKNSHWTSIP